MRPFARWLFVLAAILCVFSTGAKPYWQSRLQVSIVAGSTFQGPGDIASGATLFGSCARAYNAAYANGTNGLCDLVAVTGGAVVGTLRVATTGFADLSAYFSGSVTPAAACTAASGGSCKVTKVYDQTGNTNHQTQATLGNMPALTFASLNSLPGLTCTSAGNTSMASPSITQAQPFSMSAVYNRTSVGGRANVLASQTQVLGIGAESSANLSVMTAGNPIGQTANDNAFHALQAVLNGASGAMNTDGTDITAQNAGANTSASALRLCRNNSTQSFDGVVMEFGFWPSAFSTGNRSSICANQSSSANGYNLGFSC